MRRRVIGFLILLGGVIFALGYQLGRTSDGPLGVSLGQSLQRSDPPLVAILSKPSARTRASQLLEFFEGAKPSDVDTVRATYEAAPADAVAMVFAAEWWASFDPEGAFEQLRTWQLAERDAGLVTVVRTWAQQDPTMARQAVDEMAPGPQREECVVALVRGWSESAAGGVMEFIEQLPMGIPRQRAMDAVASDMAVRDGLDATLEFAEALPDDGERRFKLQFFRRVASVIARQDPHRAGDWALRHADGPFGDGLLRRVGAQWVMKDGAAAMAWLLSLPPSAQRDEGVRETYRAWLQRDRAAALAWLPGAEPGPALEPAVALFALAIAREDPQEGLEWLARVDDADRRQRTTIQFGRRWLASDRTAALAWLDGAELPDEIVEQILAEQRRRVKRPNAQGRAGGLGVDGE